MSLSNVCPAIGMLDGVQTKCNSKVRVRAKATSFFPESPHPSDHNCNHQVQPLLSFSSYTEVNCFCDRNFSLSSSLSPLDIDEGWSTCPKLPSPQPAASECSIPLALLFFFLIHRSYCLSQMCRTHLCFLSFSPFHRVMCSTHLK